jgi:hypothetical protein
MQNLSIKNRRLKAIVLLWTMLLVLLSAQWLGFAHRMSHISTNTGVVMTLASDGAKYLGVQQLSNANESSLHSCLLFDAACITDGLQHSIIVLFATASLDSPLVQDSNFAWLAAFNANFLSRAPPF